MWWCSYASESACLIVVVHTLRYLVLQPTNVRPVLCYVCVRTLTLRLNIMACITPGLHMGTAMHVCAHARLWQRLCCDTMYPHVLCVCVCSCAPPSLAMRPSTAHYTPLPPCTPTTRPPTAAHPLSPHLLSPHPHPHRQPIPSTARCTHPSVMHPYHTHPPQPLPCSSNSF